MNLESLVTKYIGVTEEVLGEMQREESPVTVSDAQTTKVLDYVIAYLEDAKYYKVKKRFEVSLTSIAYCEGLLDALRLIGAVSFQWPKNMKRKK